MKTGKLRLQDKVIIVTGGAQGIGKAYCLEMSNQGAKMVVADINVEAAKNTVEEIKSQDGDALTVQTDVSNLESVQNMAKLCFDRFSRIDVLLNNAAVFERNRMQRAPFWEIDPNEWDRMMVVNLKGPFLCSKAVFPYMKAQGAGKIINISSPVALAGSMNQLHYSTSKAGVIGLTKSMAKELGVFNINVNCIAPGVTQNWESTDKEFESRQNICEKLLPNRSLKRIEQPGDLVGTAIFLASSDSDFITGQTIVVDGGEVMH
jgi:NAD(P)-dependent dehydrogenase (short-subunit alcohol dehydrogenase family)